MQELIITEKPASAKKIAEALAQGKPSKENYKGVPYYRITHKNKDIIIGSAVGHLFKLAEKDKSGIRYPTFEIEWKPSFETTKEPDFTKKYYELLKKLAKEASTFTVACDYDIEGEVIGLNIIRYICNRNDAKRMKFSTLTAPDLVKAYNTASQTLDWGQAEAGETRHFLDFYYGINISRALMSAIQKAGTFKILSTGRVQGPALKIIAEKEKEIKAFKPTPFWQISLNGTVNEKQIEAWHKQDKFWEKTAAELAMKNVKGQKEGKINSIEKNSFKQLPPAPFDLTTLQTESYRCFGIKPKETLDIAQELYTAGCISYPRTSSQQLPQEIGYSNILKQLAKQKNYAQLAEELLKKKTLKPANGKKTDPAHPAIFPTGLQPAQLEARPAKIYDIIIKRFLSTFSEPATRETVNADIKVNTELFLASGTRTTEKGWHKFYAPYVKLEEIELPEMKTGDIVKIKKIEMHSKETQPPKRYTQSSIIKELEKRNLGTKATRATIIETLYDRNYVKGEAIEPTELGIHIIEILEKYCQKIVDEELTRHFEIDMEQIREHKKKKDEILNEAKNVLTEILHEFKHKEKEVGSELLKTFSETRTAMETIGQCPICKKGTIIIRKGKFGRFAACDKYPECKTTFKLPPMGYIEVGKNTCKECNYPMITMIRKAKRPQEVCINKECPSKKVTSELEGKQCTKCNEGKLILRKSVYGAFLGCDKYPKCRNVVRLEKK